MSDELNELTKAVCQLISDVEAIKHKVFDVKELIDKEREDD